MPFKLVVTHTEEPADPGEYVFDQDRVRVGRSSENHLTLPDRKRIVSSVHAEVTRKGDAYQLTDLESKNFTYLHGDRIQPGRSYPLQDGETFRVGDFEIRLHKIAATPVAPRHEQTVFDARFANPFEEGAEALVAALRGLCATYDDEPTHRQEDALEMALEEALGVEKGHEALALIARQLGAAPHEAPPSPAPAPGAAAPRFDDEDLVTPQIDRLLDTLFEALVRLVGLPWQFRHEFIGQTIMQSSEAAFLYEGDAQQLKQHLLHPGLSSHEFEQRLALLKEALEALAVHHVAMLDGYKAAAREGARQLVERLHPGALEEKVKQEQVLYKVLPLLAHGEVVRRLKGRAEELDEGDWSAAERRVYHPAFVKAYLARMTSRR